MIVLDTNVLSEVMRPAPSRRILSWLAAQPATRFFTTAVSEAEILYGVESLPRSARRAKLEGAVQAMFSTEFAGRVLPFDSSAARLYAQIVAARRTVGRPISQFDAQIAAIAKSRNASLATRNIRDFDRCGVEVVNPWAA